MTDTWKPVFAVLNVPHGCCTNAWPYGQDPMFIRTAEQQANFSPAEINVCMGLATLLSRFRSGHVHSMDHTSSVTCYILVSACPIFLCCQTSAFRDGWLELVMDGQKGENFKVCPLAQAHSDALIGFLPVGKVSFCSFVLWCGNLCAVLMFSDLISAWGPLCLGRMGRGVWDRQMDKSWFCIPLVLSCHFSPLWCWWERLIFYLCWHSDNMESTCKVINLFFICRVRTYW